MPTFADLPYLLTPGIGGSDEPSNPDDQTGTQSPPPPRTRSTATPPIAGGPVETTVTPPWDAPQSTPTSPHANGFQDLAHLFGADRDYLAEARKLIPPPPVMPGMTKGSWAALAIPAVIAGLTGGPMGLAAAGNAIGQAGVTNANRRMANWENQYKYATGLASLAGTMQNRADMAMYRQQMIQDAQARLRDQQQARSATLAERIREFDTRTTQNQQRLDATLENLKDVKGYRAASLQIRQEEAASLAASRAADEAFRAGQLDVARARLTDAETAHARAQATRDRLVDAEIAHWQTQGSKANVPAMRTFLESLNADLQDAEAHTPDPKSPAYPAYLQHVQDINRQITQTEGALKTAAGVGPTPTTSPGATSTGGSGPTSTSPFAGMTYVGTDKRTGHPVYRNAQGQYVDGVTGQVIQ